MRLALLPLLALPAPLAAHPHVFVEADVEVVVVDGAVSAPEVDGTGAFFGRHSRTAVGATAAARRRRQAALRRAQPGRR